MQENQQNTATSYSGTPQNLYDFAVWAIKKHPAQKQCFVLWNHGSGIKDPGIWGRMLIQCRDKLFIHNIETGLFELNRTFKYEKGINELFNYLKKERGIAFNDAAEEYLTNQELKDTLDRINKDLLNGQKIDVLAMDACHMAMVEVASQIKTSANIMVGSQEVEPGAGYNYTSVLKVAAGINLSPKDFASHIVRCYKEYYRYQQGDYTQSAIDLSKMDLLEQNIKVLSNHLIKLFDTYNKTAIDVVLNMRKDKILTTEFFDEDYVDLYHFCKSLINKSQEYKDFTWPSYFSSNNTYLNQLWQNINSAATNTIITLGQMTIENVSGINLPNAHGLSIYFPLKKIHLSYYKTDFSKNTNWAMFLEKFIYAKRMKKLSQENIEIEQKNQPSTLDETIINKI